MVLVRALPNEPVPPVIKILFPFSMFALIFSVGEFNTNISNLQLFLGAIVLSKDQMKN